MEYPGVDPGTSHTYGRRLRVDATEYAKRALYQMS